MAVEEYPGLMEASSLEAPVAAAVEAPRWPGLPGHLEGFKDEGGGRDRTLREGGAQGSVGRAIREPRR